MEHVVVGYLTYRGFLLPGVKYESTDLVMLGEEDPMMVFSKPGKLVSHKEGYMPEDLIVEILSRLPVKTLIRFIGVCQQWRSVIRSSPFAAKQLSLSARNPRVLLDQIQYLYILSYPNLEVVTNIKRPNATSMEVLAACDGILCSMVDYCSTGRLELWNLATNEFRSIDIVMKERTYSDLRSMTASIGYDPRTNDYKVVACCSLKGTLELVFNIYSLRSCAWRSIDVLEQIARRCFTDRESLLSTDRSVVSWLTVDYLDFQRQRTVISFNFSDETFTETPAPDSPYPSLRYDHYKLTKLKTSHGCGVFCSPPGFYGFGSCTIDLWNLDEYGPAGSWTKLLSLSVPLLGELISVVYFSPMFWTDKELLFTRNVDRANENIFSYEMTCYDPGTGRVRSSKVPGRAFVLVHNLYNPASREIRYIDIANKDTVLCYEAFIGYDLRTIDYKVVAYCNPRLYVYSLLTGTWRSIDVDMSIARRSNFFESSLSSDRNVISWLSMEGAMVALSGNALGKPFQISAVVVNHMKPLHPSQHSPTAFEYAFHVAVDTEGRHYELRSERKRKKIDQNLID
ncbi:putative F-box protein [Drosera capensis]